MNERGDEELSRLLREQATRHRASAELRARVRTSVALAQASQPAPSLPGRRRWSWASAVAGFAAGLVVSAAVVLQPGRLPSPDGDPLVAALVSEHVRALASGPLLQVESNDRHNVKPWFQGRIDFAPPVPDLSAQGFVLQGARVEGVQGAPMAVLVYRLRQHVVEVFVWPADSPPAPGSRDAGRRGFQLRTWSDGAMHYALVSDAERAELARFQRAWQESVPPP